jgi:hypothetical protein
MSVAGGMLPVGIALSGVARSIRLLWYHGAMPLRLLLTALITAVATPAPAWNALGHKVIAEIAWQQLEPETR